MKRELFTWISFMNACNIFLKKYYHLLLIIFNVLGFTTEAISSTLYLTTTSSGTQINIHK